MFVSRLVFANIWCGYDGISERHTVVGVRLDSVKNTRQWADIKGPEQNGRHDD